MGSDAGMIYIVEDDDNIRQMEAYALRGSGFDVWEASEAYVSNIKNAL